MICIILGIGVSYALFYFFIILPSPTILSQYQDISSISIFDSKKNLLYKEWNTQRKTVSIQDVQKYTNILPSKERMATYLAFNTTKLSATKDREWLVKKMVYLYPYSTIAHTYMNAKKYQKGIVGAEDAAEIFFQKDLSKIDRSIVKKLLSINQVFPKKDLYARMPIEIRAIREYIEKKAAKKRGGWLLVETSLDVQIGVSVAYQSLLNPDKEQTVFEGTMIRAWTKENDQLLAAQAIIKTKEGGEYNE